MAAMVSLVKFLGVFSVLLGLFSLLHGYGVEIEDEAEISFHSESHQPYRTGYHFQPPKNWMNDPNAPMIYNGIYHLFYQYNPFGPVWGNMTWGHSTSTDLINWIHHNHAILPTDTFDIKGCFSGSATILPDGGLAILYTGVDSENHQVQNLVVPKNLSDPFLREWIKAPQNPLMTPINGINDNSFRDPTTAWLGLDGRWRVIIGSEFNSQGVAIMYTSNDFVHWTESEHPLHSAPGKDGIWECPDFFPVSLHSKDGIDTSVNNTGVTYVLKVSLLDYHHDYYTIGSYNQEEKYIPDPGSIEDSTGLRLDYGKYYASKSFFDSEKNRRILTSWVNESCSAEHDIKKGWSGLQSIPRSIWLDKTGKSLIQWPVDEIKSLRTHQVDLPSTKLKGDSVLKISGATASQADVEVSFELLELEKAEILNPSWVDPQLLCSQMDASKKGVFGPFGLLVLASEKLEEQTAIFFRVFKDQSKYVVLMCSDQSRSSLEEDGLDKTTYGAFTDIDPLHEKISLRTLIDHSIVENFAGEGKTCITARVYPKLAIGNGAQLYVFNNGSENVEISSLSAWSMKSAQIN